MRDEAKARLSCASFLFIPHPSSLIPHASLLFTMQRCPKCGRTYENDAQKFCTHDGGRLEHYVPPPSNQGATAYDLNQTIRTNPYDPEATAPQMPDLNRTVAYIPTS